MGRHRRLLLCCVLVLLGISPFVSTSVAVASECPEWVDVPELQRWDLVEVALSRGGSLTGRVWTWNSRSLRLREDGSEREIEVLRPLVSAICRQRRSASGESASSDALEELTSYRLVVGPRSVGAGILSFLLPGLGQMALGSVREGLLFGGLGLALDIVTVLVLVVQPAEVGAAINLALAQAALRGGSMIAAARLGRRRVSVGVAALPHRSLDGETGVAGMLTLRGTLP